jgi:NTE family protein
VQPKAALTGASALLSALNIWSTGSAAPAATDETSETETPGSETLEIKASEFEASELEASESSHTSEMRNEPQVTPAAPTRSVRADGAPRQSDEKRVLATPAPVQPRSWPPRRLSLALQGGGSFGAFTWGVLDRLLEESGCEFDAISGASVGAVNAALLACGLIVDGREGARKLLARFWNRVTKEASFRSLMLVGGFSPAGSSVAFGSTLRSGQFDPFDLDPLRDVLSRDIDFAALRSPDCPKLLIAATRVRDGRQQIFENDAITADVLLASTCPPLIHCAVEISGESYWDGSYGPNPPLVRLARDSLAADILVVQVTPSHDTYVPITAAAIDRRLDQITANATLKAELAALEWARANSVGAPRIHHIAAENEIDGLAQRSPADLGHSFIALLHGRGRAAAEHWLYTAAPKSLLGAPSELVDA